MPARTAAIFDMGSVLIGWDLRPTYRAHFDGDDAMLQFLRGPFREIYDLVHDGEGTLAECLAPARAKYPELDPLIDVYEQQWASFVTGVMPDSVAVVEDLARRGVELFGLTNWPAQTWPPTRLLPQNAEDYRFLELFRDIWVSGEHRLRKPDPRSYRSALARFDLDPEQAVFVDDLEENVAAANALGIAGIHFESAPQLRRDLKCHGLL